MALIYWPKHGQNNTENSFAQYADKLFGYADRACGDTDFQLRFQSTTGTIDTWRLSAGSYVFDGYVFTSDGNTTYPTTRATATDICLYYHLDANSHIDGWGIVKSGNEPAGSLTLKLWNVQNGTVLADYRQLFTWGRQTEASTSAGAADFLSSKEASSTGTAVVVKRFRTGYPGTVRLDLDVKTGHSSDRFEVYRNRGGVSTKLTTLTCSSVGVWESKNYTVTGLMQGDYIDIQTFAVGGLTCTVKNFRIRYITKDIPQSSIVEL